MMIMSGAIDRQLFTQCLGHSDHPLKLGRQRIKF